jgi:hypothetical protein
VRSIHRVINVNNSDEYSRFISCLIAGQCAMIATVCFSHPFDTIRRRQIENPDLSIGECVSSDSIQSLYNGLGVNI